MAQRVKKTEFNLQKSGPWLLLAVLILLIFYLWPQSDQAVKPAKSVSRSENSTTSTTSSPPPVAGDKGKQARILSDMLNFRSKPSKSDRTIIATISKGTVVKVIDSQDGWLKVELNDGSGRVGFITSDPKFVGLIGNNP